MRRTLLAIAMLLNTSLAVAADTNRKPGETVEVEIAPNVKMTFCWVPAGEAQLGSPDAEREECLKVAKAPAELLRLATEPEAKRGKFRTTGFWMAKFAVTQAEWKVVMGTSPSIYTPAQEVVKKDGITDTSRFPVENVNWHDCHDFLKKLNERRSEAVAALGAGSFQMPHEDQYEYTCRGGLGNARAYYFGSEHNGTLANSNGVNPFGTDVPGPHLNRPTHVGSYERVAPHPWGLCDMHGNMWQWCENKYEESSENRVVRGGTFSSGCRGARSACRTGRAPTERTAWYGLRVIYLPDAK
jgi:formylglycine-generating enzyme required for sulfatase activity